MYGAVWFGFWFADGADRVGKLRHVTASKLETQTIVIGATDRPSRPTENRRPSIYFRRSSIAYRRAAAASRRLAAHASNIFLFFLLKH